MAKLHSTAQSSNRAQVIRSLVEKEKCLCCISGIDLSDAITVLRDRFSLYVYRKIGTEKKINLVNGKMLMALWDIWFLTSVADELQPASARGGCREKGQIWGYYLRQRLQLSPYIPSLHTQTQSAWSQRSRVPRSGPWSLRWDGSAITGRVCSQGHALSFTELENLTLWIL